MNKHEIALTALSTNKSQGLTISAKLGHLALVEAGKFREGRTP